MANVRDDIHGLLVRLLVGPLEESEVLQSRPCDTYLTGILWPPDTELGPEEDENLLEGPTDNDQDDAGDSGTPLHRIYRPSSVGITCFMEGKDTPFEIKVTGARYTPVKPEKSDEDEYVSLFWERHQIDYRIPVSGNERRSIWKTIDFLDPSGESKSDDTLAVHIKRRVVDHGIVVTASLMNLPASDEERRDAKCFFQSRITIEAVDGKAGRIQARHSTIYSTDEDVLCNNLLYRDALEYAVGHGVAAVWPDPVNRRVPFVQTSWIPGHRVSATSADGHQLLHTMKNSEPCPLGAEYLSSFNDRELVIESLNAFCDIYERWIETMEKEAGKFQDEEFRAARLNTERCRKALQRMRRGINLLTSDDNVWLAFCLANKAMDDQSRRLHRGTEAKPLIWRPFQLGFIILTISSIVDPSDEDRKCMDLLWFPTGGGKTEAYLALTAFTIFYWRLISEFARNNGGVNVLMRYTLRLLTVQQFQRAAAMICACNQIRQSRIEQLGEAPISIGLYIGQESTPNWVYKPDNDRIYDAFDAIEEEKKGNHPDSTPRMLLKCPLCGHQLNPDSYRIDTSDSTMSICCPDDKCPSGGTPLPVHTVDEEIYRVKPSLLIGTVDKFAQLPRNNIMGCIFGLPDGVPPALIIQDELHLISGPLGTMAGLYESAIEILCEREGVRPKIIGSTATIGRAPRQVIALFDRSVFQFPPPGLDADNSFFAVSDIEKPDRLYLGISSSGRSPKFTLQAIIGALIQISQYLSEKAIYDTRDLDPYWTCVTYFNSLRELGGAKVMMRDDVLKSATFYANILACSKRTLETEPVELTSRVPSSEIPRILEKLDISLFSDPNDGVPIDTLLASNMISVGVDIPRLGLMVVNGQPKTTAEYIQSTSRVGRVLPGLIVTSLNAGRPRDLSHFEHFKHYHQALYRGVEATSVTPWSSRARDKALHATFVAAVRHIVLGMVDDSGASNFDAGNKRVKKIAEKIINRAMNSQTNVAESEMTDDLNRITSRWTQRTRVVSKKPLEYWERRNPVTNKVVNLPLMRGAEEQFGDPGVWPTPNSMREVEPSAYFSVWHVAGSP